MPKALCSHSLLINAALLCCLRSQSVQSVHPPTSTDWQYLPPDPAGSMPASPAPVHLPQPLWFLTSHLYHNFSDGSVPDILWQSFRCQYAPAPSQGLWNRYPQQCLTTLCQASGCPYLTLHHTPPLYSAAELVPSLTTRHAEPAAHKSRLPAVFPQRWSRMMPWSQPGIPDDIQPLIHPRWKTACLPSL